VYERTLHFPMLTQLMSFQHVGLQSERITVEVGVHRGEAKTYIVGLGDTAVQESRQRVWVALRSSGFQLGTGRVHTVNLAPADLRKSGPRYDLPIALGILIANGAVQISEAKIKTTALIGELALNGDLRHVTGVLSAAIACRKLGITTLVVPAVNGAEAALIPDVEVLAVGSIREMVDVLCGTQKPNPIIPPAATPSRVEGRPAGDAVDFADIRGQAHAKRALEIAAAGGHNVLLSGAPGAGKTLLARAFRAILPPMSQEEAIEVSQIYSVANALPADQPLLQERPFRLVHHTASGVSIVGGGQVPRPGEISLAHKGVLFLDELAEFPPPVLEVLRQPLEDRRITITRAHGAVTFPADFILIAAMNPISRDVPGSQRLRKRISAPLLDRIDMTVNVQPVPIEDLQRPAAQTEESAAILQRVVSARTRQLKRFARLQIRTNKEMNVKHIDQLCPLDETSKQLLRQAVRNMGLSARAYHRTIKVGRTIADLAGKEKIGASHIAEALQYRQTQGLGLS